MRLKCAEIFLAAVLLSILTSCNSNELNKEIITDRIKVIDLSSPPDSVISHLSFLSCDLKYIPVLTNEISSIPVFEVIFSSNGFFVNGGSNIFYFDSTGVFQYSLLDEINQKSGFIFDFDLSSDQKRIAILQYRQVKFFEDSNGKFLFSKSFPLTSGIGKVSFVPESDMVLLSILPRKSNDRCIDIIMNLCGDTLFIKKSHYPNILPYLSEDDLIHYKVKEGVYFKHQYNDTVFFSNSRTGSVLPGLIIDTKGRNAYNWFVDRKKYFYSNYESYFTVDGIFENSDYLVINSSVHYPEVPSKLEQCLLIDKKSGRKYKIINERKLIDDLDGGPDYKMLFTSVGQAYSWNYGFEFIDSINKMDSALARLNDSFKGLCHIKSIDSLLNICTVLRIPSKYCLFKISQ